MVCEYVIYQKYVKVKYLLSKIKRVQGNQNETNVRSLS